MSSCLLGPSSSSHFQGARNVQAQPHLRHVYAHVGRPCHRRLCLGFRWRWPHAAQAFCLILPCGSPCCGAVDEDRRLLWHVSTPQALIHTDMRSQFVSYHALMHSNTHDRSTGNTEGVASRIAAKIGADKCEDIGSIEPSAFAEYDTLIVGAPTWYL